MIDKLKISIAELVIEFEFSNIKYAKLIKEKYRVYISNKKQTFNIKVELKEDLDFKSSEVKVLKNNNKLFETIGNLANVNLSLESKNGILEILDIEKAFDTGLRIIYSRLLANLNGFLVHSAAIQKDKKGYLFYGLSESGKSTISNLSAKNGLEILTDELPAIRKMNDGYYVYGTPFWGEFAGENTNKKVKLQSLISHRKSMDLKISKLDEIDFHTSFFGTILNFCTDKVINNIYLNSVADLFSSVNSYKLKFKKNDNIWEVVI